MQLVMLALIPAEPLKTELRSLMEEYCDVLGSTRALLMEPHITLAPPFMTEHLEPLSADMQQACKHMHSFELELGELHSFSDRVLFMEVLSKEIHQLHDIVLEPMAIHREHRWKSNNFNQHLTKRQKELVDKYGDPKLKEFYTPHFTLAKSDLDKQALKEILAQKPEHHLPSWHVDSVAVLVHNGKGWEVYKEVFLNK